MGYYIFLRDDGMVLYKAFQLKPAQKECISIVGAGGKTTVMQELSKELKQLGKRIVVTTTTKIYMPEKGHYDDCMISMDDHELVEFAEGITNPGIYLIGSCVDSDKKLWGIDQENIERLYAMDHIDYILVEADGSKRKPIKAPSEKEPVVPKCTTILLGLIGLDSIGMTLDEEHAHRAEVLAELCSCPLGTTIDAAVAACLIESKQGLFKSAPSASKKIVVLNKADDDYRKHQAEKVAGLVHRIEDIHVVSTSFQSNAKDCIIWK